jgi:hypothetical protein
MTKPDQMTKFDEAEMRSLYKLLGMSEATTEAAIIVRQKNSSNERTQLLPPWVRTKDRKEQ